LELQFAQHISRRSLLADGSDPLPMRRFPLLDLSLPPSVTLDNIEVLT